MYSRWIFLGDPFNILTNQTKPRAVKSPVGPLTPNTNPPIPIPIPIPIPLPRRLKIPMKIENASNRWGQYIYGFFGYGRLEIVVLDFQASRRAAPKISCYL